MQADADGFASDRNPQDTDLVEISSESWFSESAIFVIEDVNALGHRPLLPLKTYDLIFYVCADPITHLRFWLGRGWQWFKHGVFDWQPERGFQGTHRCYDPRNLLGITRVIYKQLSQRPIEENDRVILSVKGAHTVFVDAEYSKRGPVFNEPLLQYFDDSLRSA